MELYADNLLFITISFLGFFLAYLYGRKTKRFLWREYIALLAIPTICTLILAIRYSFRILLIYFVSAVVGFSLEYFLGLAYHKTLNKRLWTYDNHRYSIDGYTSLLTLPMWGIAGVFFWMLGRFIETF